MKHNLFEMKNMTAFRNETSFLHKLKLLSWKVISLKPWKLAIGLEKALNLVAHNVLYVNPVICEIYQFCFKNNPGGVPKVSLMCLFCHGDV